jgi:hypothetical protein
MAGPVMPAVTTRPVMVKYGDEGSTVMRAGAPARAPGMMVIRTALPFSEAADEGERKAAESVFCS